MKHTDTNLHHAMSQKNRTSKYKLLFLHAEGSLYRQDHTLSDIDIEALVAAQAVYGLRIAIIGSSSLDSLLPLVGPLQLDTYSGYLLPQGGSSIYNCHTNQEREISPCDLLHFFIEKLDLLREEIICVGYRPEDTGFMQSAGLGVAMGDAPEAVKACADYITLPTSQSGIAHLINKYIREDTETLPITPEAINQLTVHSLIATLGITCTHIAKGYVEGTMPVNEHTRQPMGIVHGGANLAFAETLAGFGSVVLLKDRQIQVGTQVSGYHVAGAMEGDTMRGEARILHKGRSTHVWSVEIYSCKSGKLIHTARVLNSIINAR